MTTFASPKYMVYSLECSITERQRYKKAKRQTKSIQLIYEKITLYLAKGLHKGTRNLDEDEFLNIVEIPLGKLVEDVMNDEISDGKTQVALLKAWNLLNK